MKSRRTQSPESDVRIEPQAISTELSEEGEASSVLAFARVEQKAWERLQEVIRTIDESLKV